MTPQIKTKAGLKKAYERCPQEVRDYFEHVPKLLDEFPMDVCLAYVFSCLELGQNMTLYCGVVKIYKVNSELARNAVERQHMSRKKFIELYKTIFGLDLPDIARKNSEEMEKTRDKIMHGKTVSDDQIRNAIACVLNYAEEVNNQLHENYQLKPFGELRGFAGRSEKLDKSTSRFVLLGMGFLKND